jgi:hypothetical protein
VVAPLVGLAGLAGVGTAGAQESDRLQQANAAFSRGLALENAAGFAEALAQFEAAAALAGREAPQTELHIGHCQSKLGLLADARQHLVHAVELARASGAKRVEQAAQEELDQVAPRVPTLTLAKPAQGTVTRVAIDDRAVPVSALGTPLALNAVEHHVAVDFDGRPPLALTVVLREGAHETVSLEPPGTAPAPAKPPPAPARPPPAATPVGDNSVLHNVVLEPTETAPPASHGGVLGWVLLGGGAALAAGGAVFWVLRGNEMGTLDSGCPSRTNCPANLKSDDDKGKLYDALGITLFSAAGAAVLAGGGVLLFGGSKSAPAGSLQVAPVAGAGGGGLTVRGRF